MRAFTMAATAIALTAGLGGPALALKGPDADRGQAMRAAEAAVPGARATDAAMSEQCGIHYWFVQVSAKQANYLVLADARARVLRVVEQ